MKNHKIMKTNVLLIIGIVLATMNSCEQKDPLQVKKDELKEQKTELKKIKVSIAELEQEISALDPDFAKENRRATLITTKPVETKVF